MAMGAQEMIDRRRLRAKLGFWRMFALLTILAAIALVPLWAGGLDGLRGPGPGIARVEISGVIRQDTDMLELLDRLRRDESVRAVVIAVNSPGGTTVGGESLYEAVRAIAAEKPVVAEIGSLGASAGYMVAAAADHIVARQSSIVGSIGVIFQYVDASQLLGRVGVDVNAVRSTPLKAEPSPFAPAPPEAREMIARLVDSTYRWFVDLVAERRGFSPQEAAALADGSVFSGRQGLENRLVDALGGEREVRRWLESEGGVPEGLPIVEREPQRDRGPFGFLPGIGRSLLAVLGLDPEASDLPDALRRAGGQLDGLVSLWQPLGGDFNGPARR